MAPTSAHCCADRRSRPVWSVRCSGSACLAPIPLPLRLSVLLRRGVNVSQIARAPQAALPEASGTFRVRVGEALARPIGEILTANSHWGEKIDAAVALNAFTPTPPVVQALVHGVESGGYLVRRHSAQSLLTLAPWTRYRSVSTTRSHMNPLVVAAFRVPVLLRNAVQRHVRDARALLHRGFARTGER
jgi:hypothetical protein